MEKECTIRFCQVQLHQSFCCRFLSLRCDVKGWPQNKNFISQFRRKKKIGEKGLLFKSVFIMHQNKAIMLPKPSHTRAREEKEEEAKWQIGQHLGFPLHRRRPSSQLPSAIRQRRDSNVNSPARRPRAARFSPHAHSSH